MVSSTTAKRINSVKQQHKYLLTAIFVNDSGIDINTQTYVDKTF